MLDPSIAERTATALIQGGAYRVVRTGVQREWFTWKSGIVAPVYCDVRQLMNSPSGRTVVAEGLHHTLTTAFPSADGVIGMATAGIYWAAILAQLANIPAGYVRTVPKSHGLRNVIEYSAPRPGNLVVVDDLVATGASVAGAIKAVENAGYTVIGVLSVVNWDFQKMHSQLAGYAVSALVSFPQIIARLALPPDAEADLKAFYQMPDSYDWKSELFSVAQKHITA